MRKTKKTLAMLAIVSMVATMVPMQVFANTGVPTRISGTSQYDTAVEIAKQWPAGTTKAVLAYGGSKKASLADALASGPLAAALGAPILLTDGDTLTSATVQELKDLGVNTVYVTSGTSVIKNTVLDQLADFTVKPVWGVDAPATSVEIAKAMETATGVNPTAVALANGAVGAQDALSVASIASAKKFPILISDNKASLPKVVKDYLATLSSVTKSYAIGGTSVISDDQKSELTGAVRLSGNDAYDTNAAVIKAFSDANAVNFTNVFVANGETLVDALSGAPLAAKYNAVIALTDGSNVKASATVNALIDGSSVVTALGGVNAVPASAVGKVAYQAPATTTLSVVSVSAINASQIAIVFNNAVNKSSIIDANNLLIPAVQITRLPDNADENTITANTLLATLSTDKKTLTLTADPANSQFFEGTYSFYIPGNSITADANGELLPSYTTTLSVSDKTAPAVSSVTFNSATNRIDVKVSEPLATAPTVTVNGGAPLQFISLNTAKTTYSYANTWTMGTDLSVNVFGAIDMEGNDQVSTYSATVTLTQNTTAPTVTAIAQSDSNVIKVTFSKAPSGATDGNKATTVWNSLAVYRAGVPIAVTNVDIDSNDSSKCTYKVTLDPNGAPDYDFYNSKASVTLNVNIADEAYVDVFGIANDGEIAKTVVMTKDSNPPLISNVVLNSDKDGFLVFFNKKVDDSTAAALGAGISVRKDGIDVTGAYAFSTGSVVDDQVIELLNTVDIPSGVYTIRFDDNSISDTVGNEIDAKSVLITVDSTDSVVTVASITNPGTNQYVVTFSAPAGISAVQATNYTLDGAALPSGTDLYFSLADKTQVTISLPSSSVNYNSLNSVLRVANVLDSNGSKITASSNGTMDVVDNIKPVLQSASVSGNIITLKFDEDMADASGITTFAELLSDLSIKGGTVDLVGTTGALAASTDGSKVVIVVTTVGDSNWNTVKAYANLTIKTKDNSTFLTDDDSANIIKKDVSVTAPVNR